MGAFLRQRAHEIRPAVRANSSRRGQDGRTLRRRALMIVLGAALAFVLVSARLVELSLKGVHAPLLSQVEAPPSNYARPDIVDRNGRLLATDVAVPSLYADPALVLDRDEAAEKLAAVLPGLDQEELRRDLAGKSRRFVWVRRGLAPRLAQAAHDLGLPGFGFRNELRRAYPLEPLAAEVIGSVDTDNRGRAGLERYVDSAIGIDGVHGATLSGRVPVRLSLDTGVTHSLRDELATALRRFGARAAAGLVMDVDTGEVVATASIEREPQPTRAHKEAIDRVAGGTYELGSLFKIVTVAMALDGGKRGIGSILDVTKPLVAGRYTIEDPHPAGRPLTLSEVFTLSSNVGAGLLALEAGPERQKEFLDRLGLLMPMITEAGAVAEPLVPGQFGRAEQITVAYGHGLAVAPIQFAAAAASIINGGERVLPTYLSSIGQPQPVRGRTLSAAASSRMRELMRLNVTEGTGKRAGVPGYDVGGKTGTAEMADKGGYAEKRVIASFLAAFPMKSPRYLVLVSLFEPHGTPETDGDVTAGTNAAPTAGRIIARIAPQLGVFPDTGKVAELGLGE